MNYITHILALSTIIITNECNSPNPIVPRPTPVAIDTELCPIAEKHLLELHCKEGEPTKKGKSFSDFCKEKQDNGVFMNPKCLSTINNCSEINTCTNSN